jgi:hypothetical protein
LRKIALIGTGASGVDGPYNDPQYEIWGVASRFPYVTRAERWYELHRLDGEPLDFQHNWRTQIKQWSGLEGFGEVTLYMLYPEPDLGPRVVPYPYQHIVDRFGTYFMTSSFAWMLAHALDELRPINGPPVEGEIGVWGVDMEYGTEYRQQRAGFRHFVDVARVLGVNVTRFADSGLSFEPVPYPLWQDDPLLAKVGKRKKETNEKLDQAEKSLNHTRSMIAQNQMAIEELNKVPSAKTKGYVAKRTASLQKELDALLSTSAELSREIVYYSATEAEQRYWSDYLQP